MISILMAVVALAAADTPAAGPAPAAPAAQAQAKPKAPKMICWQEEPTGSHFPHRVCATKDELEARQRRDQDALGAQTHNQPSGFGASGGSPR